MADAAEELPGAEEPKRPDLRLVGAPSEVEPSRPRIDQRLYAEIGGAAIGLAVAVALLNFVFLD